MKKYDNYKPSGVEWLGEIPEHWEVKKLKHLIQSKTGFAFQSDKFSDEGIPLIRISDLNESGIVLLDKAPKLPQKNEKYLKEYGLKRNDILFAMTGGTIGKVATYNQDTPALLNQRVCLFRIYDKNLRKIVYYWMQTLYWKNYIDLKSIGGAQPNISDVTVLNLQIFVSNNQEEQTAIANFLDDKTTKIDQAIAIKQKQIELLKERRQILIHKAVTRGLNDDVKMKDSGVEWIGEIPEHWEVNKLFGLCNFIRGNSTFSKDELLSSGDYVALQYGKTYKVDEINDNYRFYINDVFYKESQIVKNGDTILISTSETIEDLGHSAFYRRNDLGLLGGEQILLNPNNKKINGQYLYYYSKTFSKELRKFATGIKVYRFNVNNLKTINISLPALSEQKQIVEFIETATTKIATAISLKEQEIEKLKEYKMSLIDGVVTGKVKVS